MALIKVGNIRGSEQAQARPSGMVKVGNIKTGVTKPTAPKRTTPLGQKNPNYIAAKANADAAIQEANKANSVGGMAVNALKEAPRAAANVLIGNPIKLGLSALEVPEIVKNRAYTNREYNVPGLGKMKSFQSDYGQVEKDVIEGKKGLGSAAWSLAQIPLAGLETGGIARGLKTAYKAKSGADAAKDIADAFLPSFRNTGSSKSLGTVRQGAVQKVAEGVQAQENILPPVPGRKMPSAQVPESVSSADTIPQNLSKLRKTVTSGETVLQKSGKAGEELKTLLKNEQVDADLQAGKWKSLVKQFTGELDDTQRANLTDVLEGKANPIDAKVAASSKVMRNFLNKVQKTAKDTGLDVGYREDYFPRQYNWDEIIKGKRKEEVLQHMVDSGQASTKAEADSFLRDFIGKNRERKAGNLEYERMFDVPGYEKDPEKALTMYADSAARRISEAKAFGPKDEIPSALINKIADGGGDYMEAQKIFDYVYKGEPKNAFAQFLLGYNTFTKLSLGFFSNLTQSVNTSAKAGLLNTVKGAGQALAQGVKAVKNKNYDDLSVLANTLDDHVVMQESGLSNKFIQGAMYLFQKVEAFNRRTATYAGKYRAEELANILKSDPQSAFAARQLESLGIKVSDVVNGKLTEAQIARAANKMVRATQFKIDALNLPTMWRSPLGKVLMQFKSFSFMQTKFIRDEILKEAKQGNLAPLVRFIAIAPVASYVTQSMRNAVNQVDPENEKKNPSFRKGDLYRKAVGDLPSDFATQMKYAYDKSQATYQDAKGQQYPSTSLVQDIKNFASPFTGPSVGDAAELLSSLDRISSEKQRNMSWYANHPEAQSDPYLNLKRFAVSKVPFVGRGLTNKYLDYEQSDAKKAKELMKEGIRTNNRELIDEAIKQDPYLYNEKVIRNVIGKKIKEMTPDEKALYDEIKQMRNTKPYYTP